MQEKYGGEAVRQGATINKSTSCSPQDEPSQPVAGVIGAAFSGVSIMVANILKLFKVASIVTNRVTRLSYIEYFYLSSNISERI